MDKTDEDYLKEDIQRCAKEVKELRAMSRRILSVWHPATEHLLDALVSLHSAVEESDKAMDCGVSDIPTTAGCSFCGLSRANEVCGCKCHQKE